MFILILTKKDKSTYFVGCDGSVVNGYDCNNAFKYEFEDYEDAENTKMDYVLDHWQDENADEIENIKVVQM